MDEEKITNDIPRLPPPDAIPLSAPCISAKYARLLRRAYTVWCTLTLFAASLTLVMLCTGGVMHLRESGDGYLRRLVLTRVLGVGSGAEDDSLIELMLGQILYPRGMNTLEAAVIPEGAETLPPPEAIQPAESIPAEDAPEPIDVYAYDPDAVPPGELPILPLDLSLSEYGSLYISNETAYTPDIAALLEKEDVLPPYDPESALLYPVPDPIALILHTHGTEAYSPDGAISYAETDDYARSSDPRENVIAVGERMAEVLRDNGVPTLHCIILHDKDAYRDSYLKAAETIRAYLAEYPSIQYIFDVHRDALIRGEGDLVRPVTAVGDEAVAQVMVVAGSDYKGAVFPDWQNNLAFGLQLRENLNLAYPGLARPVYLRGAAFNEHLGPLSLLLEIGASGNSLEEALRAGELVAETLADMIRHAK